MGIQKTIELMGRIDIRVLRVGGLQKDDFIQKLFSHLTKKASAFQSNGAQVKSINFLLKDLPLNPKMNFTAVLYIDIGEHVQDLSFGAYDSEKEYLKQLLNYLYSEAKGFQSQTIKVDKFLIQTV